MHVAWMCITKLRKHLKEDPSIEIINIYGKGYKLITPEPGLDRLLAEKQKGGRYQSNRLFLFFLTISLPISY